MGEHLQSIGKKEISAFSLGLAIGTGLIVALEHKFPKHRYQTTDPLPLRYRIVDTVLEFIFMRFRKILAHNWHWKDIHYDPEYDKFGVFLKGAASGNSSNTPFFGAIAHLGGRSYGYLIGLNKTVLESSLPSPTFTIGFRNPGAKTVRVCSLKQTKPIMMLAGPDSGCMAYAFDKYGQPLLLAQLSPLMHRSKLPPNTRVL